MRRQYCLGSLRLAHCQSAGNRTGALLSITDSVTTASFDLALWQSVKRQKLKFQGKNNDLSP
jgi:hypothetical protein